MNAMKVIHDVLNRCRENNQMPHHLLISSALIMEMNDPWWCTYPLSDSQQMEANKSPWDGHVMGFPFLILNQGDQVFAAAVVK